MNSDLEGMLSQIEEARREWQAEMDQAQQIFRDLLATISELSGVELPAMAIDDQRPGSASLRIGFKTLKDRIRNDLEAFSSSAAVEVGKKAHEKGQTILEPLQKEMGERLDTLAEEFRVKLQERLASGQDEVAEMAKGQVEQIVQDKMGEFAEWINLMSEGAVASVPQKVERAVEPHVLEVTDRLKASFQQQLHFILHDQEKASQEKVRELQGEIQAQIGKLAEEVRHSSQQGADLAIKSFTERLEGVTDDAFKNLESRVEAGVERNLNHFRQRLGELSTSAGDGLRAFTDQQTETLRQNLQKVAQELQEKGAAGISENIDKITKDALESSLQNLRGQLDGALEASKGELKNSMQALMENVQKQMSDLGQAAHETLSQDVAGLADNLRNMGEALKTAENERLAAAQENLASLTHGALESVAANMKQIVDTQIAEVQKTLQEFQAGLTSQHEVRFRETVNAQQNDAFGRLRTKTEEAAAQAVTRITTTSDQIVQGLSEKVSKEVNTATSLLKDWAHQTTAWAESTIKNSLETYRGEVAQLTDTVLERQRKTVNESLGELQNRLEQAAGLLRGLNNGHRPAGTNDEAA
ncbi:MAG TPA: hypothetical protein VNG91_05210 [Terriglobia bacterium]|nr:hypothetical protein [Terriglobia bacterium]